MFEPDKKSGGFVVTFPDFGYGVTQGETLEEALDMAQDLLKCTIADFIEADKDLPNPAKPKGKHYHQIGLPILEAMKVELYVTFRESGMRKAELARRTGIAKANIDRLFDLNHASRVDQVEAAFRALGKSLAVDVTDAA